MRLIVTIAIMLAYITVIPPVVIHAEPSDENRSVADQLNGTSQVEDEQMDSVEVIEEPEVFVQKNPFLMFAQLIAALIFVVFLIYVLFRFLNKRSQSYRSTQTLQNIGGVQLGANRSVQLVKVGDRLLVVGVGETIQLLKEIDQKDEIERILVQQEGQFDQMDQPLNKLLKLLKGRKKSRDEVFINGKNMHSSGFKDLLTKQLKDVKDSQQEIHEAVRERDK